MKPKSSSEPEALLHTSLVFRRLLDEARDDHFTLDWLVANLRKRSYGMLMLVLALFALVPGVSFFAGLLLVIPSLQTIAGRPAPVFPRRIAARPLSTRHLAGVVRRTLPVLKYLGKLVHPRWHTPPQATKRLVGAVVLILSVPLVAAPIPFGNVVPALVIAPISLAYLEEDGLLLSIALLAAVTALTVLSVAVGAVVFGANSIVGLW